MDSVIIAAGFGTRLRSVAKSKPLAKICGISLLEISVRQLALAGVDRIFVVTGSMADEIDAALPAIAASTKMEITAVRVDDWTVPNGYSVMAGAKHVKGDYLLVMADHILSSEIFDALCEARAPEGGAVLGVDRRLDNPLVDPDDATYVRTDNAGKIIEICKGMDGPDAIDCGAFLASSGLSDAIAAAISDGRSGSLSDGMQWLADRGKASTLDISQYWWMDVDDFAAHTIAERELPNQLPHLLKQ